MEFDPKKLFTPEERAERAERCLQAIKDKAKALGWKENISPANWVEQLMCWMEDLTLKGQR